ncbi:MAG TPA: LysR family transcriptional regulator [Gammaproteobacteria bacterium]
MARIEDIQTFMRVVEAGSISAAAERLGIAKSAVSRRLSDLETRLGVQLLRRTTRRLNLTDTGRGFYDRCQRILADLEEAEAAVSQAHGTLQGRLRVAAPLSFGLLHLGPAITDFMQRHPRVEFDLDFNDRQVDLLGEDIDVAIRITRQLDDSSLIARRLWSSRVAVCASPDYLREHGTPLIPADLAAHQGLVYSNAPDPTLWALHDANGREYRVRVQERLRSNNGDFLRQAALAGEGIVLSPSFIAHESLWRGELVAVLSEYTHTAIHAYALYPQTRHLSQRVRAFVDFLAERYAGVPYWDRELPE